MNGAMNRKMLFIFGPVTGIVMFLRSTFRSPSTSSPFTSLLS